MASKVLSISELLEAADKALQAMRIADARALLSAATSQQATAAETTAPDDRFRIDAEVDRIGAVLSTDEKLPDVWKRAGDRLDALCQRWAE